MAKSLMKLTLVVAVVLGVAGCSGGGSAGSESSPGPSGALANRLASAKAGGASQEQLAILAKGLVPSFEDYEAAVNRDITCLRDAGIDVVPIEPQQMNGITVLDFGTPVSSPGRTDAETAQIAEACYAEHARWVNIAWQTQPAAMEAQEKAMEESRPKLIECLERNGVDVDESLSTSDILTIANDLARKTGEVDPDSQVACAVEAGSYGVK